MSDDSAQPTSREAWGVASMARQREVLARLEQVAREAQDRRDVALAWLALRRQVDRYLRSVDVWARQRPFRRLAAPLAEHRDALAALGARATGALAGLGAPDVELVRRAGLRIAVTGKGGAGKTLVAGTLARLLARRGRQVLAADLDTNPGLAFTLGVPPEAGALPPEALEEHPGAAYGWQLRSGLDPVAAVSQFAYPGPDGTRFLRLGKIDEPGKEDAKRSVVALLQVLLGLGDAGWDVIGDMEAGPTTPFERYHAFADLALVVVGPEWRSALTARRLLPLVDEVPTLVVGNRFRDERDHPGLPPVVRIPFDPAVAEAERRGLAPLDACPGSPAIQALERLVDELLEAAASAA